MGFKVSLFVLFALLFGFGISCMIEPSWVLSFTSNPNNLSKEQTAKLGLIVVIISLGLAALVATTALISPEEHWEDEKRLDLD